MATKDVKLPDIGEGVTEGEMVKWLVKVGDTVKADQPIAEVMTDKATVEVPSPVAGVVKELKAKEGDVVPIETTLLVLEVGGAAPAAAAPAAASHGGGAAKSSANGNGATTSAPMAAAPAKAPTAAPAGGFNRGFGGGGAAVGTATHAQVAAGAGDVYPPAAGSHVLATPATRRLARESNVDINQLSGTGLAGRVTMDDVQKAKSGHGAVAAGPATFGSGAAPTGAAPVSAKGAALPLPPRVAYASTNAADERVPMRGIRRKIAEQMQMAKHVIPHFTIMDEAKVDELVKLRTQSKEAGEKYGVKVTYLPFVMKALIATIREFPMFNASIDDQAGEIVYKKQFNIAFAADTPQGLMVPVIKNADQKTILEISKEIGELAVKARNGKLALEDMKGATITITNIGSVGGTYATPVINHPEVAIIGMYKVETKPFFKDGAFVPVQTMNFTATCDHRLIDGAVAANFLKAFLKRIENPGQLVLEMI